MCGKIGVSVSGAQVKEAGREEDGAVGTRGKRWIGREVMPVGR